MRGIQIATKLTLSLNQQNSVAASYRGALTSKTRIVRLYRRATLLAPRWKV